MRLATLQGALVREVQYLSLIQWLARFILERGICIPRDPESPADEDARSIGTNTTIDDDMNSGRNVETSRYSGVDRSGRKKRCSSRTTAARIVRQRAEKTPEVMAMMVKRILKRSV